MEASKRLYEKKRLTKDELNAIWVAANRANMAGDFAAAAEQFKIISELLPTHRQFAGKVALMAWHFRKHGEACRIMAWYLEAFPNDADMWFNLGKFRQDMGHAEEAAALYQHALLLKPTIEATANLALCYHELGRGEDAEALFDHALTMNAQSPEARFNRSFVRLARGDFAGGWKDYEARRECLTFQWSHDRQDLPGERWNGEELWPGAVLLVYTEQGFGDVIQFSRFVPQLRERLPGVIISLEVPGELERLFRSAWPDLELGPRGVPPGRYDAAVSILSLPALCGVTLETVPPPVPFQPGAMRHDEDEIFKFCGDRPRIGLAWAGSKMHPQDARRSMPDDQVRLLLEAVPGIAWFSLQVGEKEDALAAHTPTLAEGSTICFARDGLRDFMDSAALMKRLDAVVTVDTAVAHLAGTLGVPTLLCVHTPSEWRWMKDRTDSPWYPTTRLVRQARSNDWSSVLDDVAKALVEFSGAIAA